MKRIFTAIWLAALLSVMPGLIFAQGTEMLNPNESDTQEKSVESEETEEEGKESWEIVVTATKLETSSKEVASSITVINKQQIQEMQKETILDVLRTVPSLDVVQSGGPGKATSVFIRGAKSEHTLVLIDGVEMNDPVSAGRSFDFAHLTTDNVARIEIIRGPQSTLYGSDAIGGIINIITESGKGKSTGFISGETGSLKTLRGQAGISGGTELLNYSLGLSVWDTEGISAAGEQYGNIEKDGYKNTSFSGKVGVTPNDNFDAVFTVRYLNADADLDESGGTGGDDPNYKATWKQLFMRGQARLSLFNNLWEQKLGISLSNHDREYLNETDEDHPRFCRKHV
jgi:vitamin B12 transporter